MGLRPTTPQNAAAYLKNDDVTVTNASDKAKQLDKVSGLDEPGDEVAHRGGVREGPGGRICEVQRGGAPVGQALQRDGEHALLETRLAERPASDFGRGGETSKDRAETDKFRASDPDKNGVRFG